MTSTTKQRPSIVAVKGALIALSLLAPAAAYCQAVSYDSTLLLYGRIDASVNYQHYAGQGATRSTNGTYLSSDTSLFGLKGSENLGGGMNAYFKLESGFNVNDGKQSSPTTFFNRESYVGLSSTSYGSIQLGSQFTPAVWISGKSDVFARSNTGAIITLLQQGGSSARGFPVIYLNALQYISPTIVGFTGRAMYGFTNDGVGSSNAFSVEYSGGNLYAGAYYTRYKMAGSAAGVPLATVSSKTYGLGVTYRFDLLKLYGHIERNMIDQTSTMFGYDVGIGVPFGASELRGSFTHRDVPGVPGSGASLYALGYFYFLSKTTTVYASLGYLKNGQKTNFGVWPASQNAGTLPLGDAVSAVQIGVRQLF